MNEQNPVNPPVEDVEVLQKNLIEADVLEMGDITFKLADGYILRQVGEGYMVMPVGPRMKDYKGMITLNETGAFLFKEAQKPNASNLAAIEALIQEYGCERIEAHTAVYTFMRQCAECGLMPITKRYYNNKTRKPMTLEEVEAWKNSGNKSK